MVQKKGIFAEVKSYAILTLGMCLYAFSASAIIVPQEIVGGGATGLGTLVYYLTNGLIPVGVTYFLVNLILLSIAFKVLGAKFGIKSIYGIILSSILLSILQPLFPTPLVSDKFLSAVVGGMLTGVGIALALIQGGSTGGTDIVAMLVTHYRNISPAKVLMYSDSLVICCALFLNFEFESLIYGFVQMGVLSYTVDFVLTGQNQSAQLFIFTEKYKDVATEITRHVARGVTVVDCTGWYTGQAKKVLIIVVRKTEATEVLRIAKLVDPHVFMTMNTVVGVFGQGFDELKGVKNVEEKKLD